MAVLVEGISVIVRLDRLQERYPGGREAFERRVPNNTFCCDDELARVGFVDPSEVRNFVDHLAESGLRYIVDGEAQDLVVADQQKGFMALCDWAECVIIELAGDPIKRVACCKLKGSESTEFALPDEWQFEESLTSKFHFVPSIAANHVDEAIQASHRGGWTTGVAEDGPHGWGIQVISSSQPRLRNAEDAPHGWGIPLFRKLFAKAGKSTRH